MLIYHKFQFLVFEFVGLQEVSWSWFVREWVEIVRPVLDSARIGRRRDWWLFSPSGHL